MTSSGVTDRKIFYSIESMENIVILTGAGISAESGLQTFRGNGGLWEGQPVEKVATPEAFFQNPELVYRFYNLRRAQLQDVEIQANPAHLALSLFEKKQSGNFSIVTQNVDNLHEQAGSQNIYHMHGELLKARCLGTGEVFPWIDDLDSCSIHPKGLQHKLRPHIVWFGEMPLYMGEIQSLLENCDTFISIGTSGHVYPAAEFVSWTNANCRTIEFNLESTKVSSLFKETILGPATQTVPEFFAPFL